MAQTGEQDGAPTGASRRRGPFVEGDRVQLTDSKGRMHTITLTGGKQFHTHRGIFEHDELIGQPEGSVVRTTNGVEYLALRPLLADYVLSMPRGAAVVYPKDAGQVVAMGDIYPGAVVVEAGVGSGALTMSLLRAVGDGGHLRSVERRAEFATIARANVEEFFGGPHPAWELTVGDLVEVLDRDAGPAERGPRGAGHARARGSASTPCPGRSSPVASSSATSRRPPSCPASPRRRGRTGRSPSRRPGSRWSGAGTSRAWPCARSTAWSGTPGFLVTARRLAPDVVPPLRRRRPAKGAYDSDQTEQTEPTTDRARTGTEPGTEPGTTGHDRTEPPGEPDETGAAYGERQISERTLRRRVRAAGHRNEQGSG